MSEIKLKPCPFCGANAEIHVGWTSHFGTDYTIDHVTAYCTNNECGTVLEDMDFDCGICSKDVCGMGADCPTVSEQEARERIAQKWNRRAGND